jgi:hypothetical protein
MTTHTTLPTVLLTQSDLAELLEKSPQTIRVWVKKGYLTPPTKVGGRAMFNLDQVRIDVAKHRLDVSPSFPEIVDLRFANEF